MLVWLTWTWVLIGGTGTVLAMLVLREVDADWQASKQRAISKTAHAFLRETIRTTWYRLIVLASFTLAGFLPALSPLPGRPVWVRLASLLLLIFGLVALTVDTGLRLRAKRRILDQLRRDRDTAS